MYVLCMRARIPQKRCSSPCLSGEKWFGSSVWMFAADRHLHRGASYLGIKSFVHDATTLILGSSRRFRVGQQRTNNSAVESPSLLGITPLLTRLQKQTCACDSSKHLMERLSLCIMVGLRTTLNDRSRIPVCSLCAEIPQESRLSLYEFEILACLEFIFVPETHTDRLIGNTGAK